MRPPPASVAARAAAEMIEAPAAGRRCRPAAAQNGEIPGILCCTAIQATPARHSANPPPASRTPGNARRPRPALSASNRSNPVPKQAHPTTNASHTAAYSRSQMKNTTAKRTNASGPVTAHRPRSRMSLSGLLLPGSSSSASLSGYIIYAHARHAQAACFRRPGGALFLLPVRGSHAGLVAARAATEFVFRWWYGGFWILMPMLNHRSITAKGRRRPSSPRRTPGVAPSRAAASRAAFPAPPPFAPRQNLSPTGSMVVSGSGRCGTLPCKFFQAFNAS